MICCAPRMRCAPPTTHSASGRSSTADSSAEMVGSMVCYTLLCHVPCIVPVDATCTLCRAPTLRLCAVAVARRAAPLVVQYCGLYNGHILRTMGISY